MQIQDITGQTFGRWTVVKYHDSIKYPRCSVARWLCRCDCGAEKIVRGQSLKNGRSTSCICFRKEHQRQRQFKHGMVKSPEYAAWAHMMDRCGNPKNPAYKDYGSRGITVCERWTTAANFLNDMGKRPSSKHSLERKNNDMGYSPENCVWATQPEQQTNKRTNRRLRFNGRVQTITEWSREVGLSFSIIWNRLDHGWSTAEALTIPASRENNGWDVRRMRQRP